jgi:ATP-dependent Clp protease ATP-binding subunit ClpA
MFERYTDRMRRMIVRSQELARERHHNDIGTEHLLLGLVDDEEAVGSQVLRAMNISLDEIRQRVDEIIGAGQGAPTGHIPFTPRARKVLELGLREALQLGDHYIGTEHHLLALIREDEGVAAQVLLASGADLNRARQQVILVRRGYQSSGDTWPEDRPDSDRVIRPVSSETSTANISRFTDRARRVVVLAQEEARTLSHNYIGTEHILLGLIREREGVAARALEEMGVSLGAARQQVEEIIGLGQQAPSDHIPFTPRARRVLELGLREALQLGHNHIGTEHILLGLIREGDGVAVQVLVRLGADLNRTRQQVIELLHSASDLRTRPPTPRPGLLVPSHWRHTWVMRVWEDGPVDGRRRWERLTADQATASRPRDSRARCGLMPLSRSPRSARRRGSMTLSPAWTVTSSACCR